MGKHKNSIVPDTITVTEALAKFPRHSSGKTSKSYLTFVNRTQNQGTGYQKKESEEKTNKLKTLVMTPFEDAEQITYKGIRLATLETQTSNLINTKKLQAKHPDIETTCLMHLKPKMIAKKSCLMELSAFVLTN